jgi:hypothetical protein
MPHKECASRTTTSALRNAYPGGFLKASANPRTKILQPKLPNMADTPDNKNHINQ